MMTNWKTKDGRVIAISEMTDTHLLNSIRYVERKIEANANEMFSGYDPMMVPDNIKQDSARLFEAAKRQDRGWMSLMGEAVKRKILMWDGSPVPWEKSPFSPPEEKKKETSREVRVVKQKISASQMDRLKAEEQKNKKKPFLEVLTIRYEDQFVAYIMSKYDSGEMTKPDIRAAVMKLQGVVDDESFIRVRDRVGRGVMDIDRKISERAIKAESRSTKKALDLIKRVESRDRTMFVAATPESLRAEMDLISETYREKPQKQNKKSDDVSTAEWKPGKRRIVID